MKEKIIENLEKLLNWIESSTTFIVEQTPILVQEILQFYTILHIIYIGIALIFLVLGLKLFFSGIKVWASDDWVDESPPVLKTIFGTIFITIGSITSVSHVLALIKVTVAPRLYLLQRITDLF